MSIESEADLLGLRAVGAVVAEALEAMRRRVAPGVTTLELDAAAEAVLRRHGAGATPQRVYGFPGWSCVSVNSEAVHGIPGKRMLRDGDVVKLDVTADLAGFVADAARTVVVGLNEIGARLAACARAAFEQALLSARAGNRTRDIGRAVEREVHRHGFAVLPDLAGHGVGRSVHEPPCVPNYDEPRARDVLVRGMVLTIEPIIAARRSRVYEARDGWTIGTANGSLTAHHEETIVITDGLPIVLTAA
ncbi:MAG: type I methionyl aminopeptidase [Gemmataceae bacterium]